MKFTIVKTIVVTTKELYETNIAGFLDPLTYIADQKPESVITERQVSFDIFREEVKDERAS